MDLPIWLAVGYLGTGVFLFIYVIAGWIVSARDPARRRLAAIATVPYKRSGFAALTARWSAWLTPLGGWLLPGSKTESNRIQRLLFLGGFRGPNAMAIFFGFKALCAVLLPMAWLLGSMSLTMVTSKVRWPVAAFAVLVALVVPNHWLERRVARRQKVLRDGFPEALDMLVICVEAGLGLTAAISRVAEELKYSQPELAGEFEIVNAEMRSGVDREVALTNLNVRTGLKEIHGLVSLLVQTLRFGTGVADSLRIYSSEFRDRRTQTAEERAGKIGTKLIFPLLLCEFPAFFVIAVGPAVLRLVEVFGSK